MRPTIARAMSLLGVKLVNSPTALMADLVHREPGGGRIQEGRADGLVDGDLSRRSSSANGAQERLADLARHFREQERALLSRQQQVASLGQRTGARVHVHAG